MLSMFENDMVGTVSVTTEVLEVLGQMKILYKCGYSSEVDDPKYILSLCHHWAFQLSLCKSGRKLSKIKFSYVRVFSHCAPPPDEYMTFPRYRPGVPLLIMYGWHIFEMTKY